MAIQPPSDILLDVAAAADPEKVRAATARLAKLAADPAIVDKDFGKALAAATAAGKSATNGSLGASSPSKAAAAAPTHVASSEGPTLKREVTHKGDIYQKFEAVLLQNFVESMLPKNDELYGGKETAGAFRSMMAEQLANQISKAGGIGIAKAVEHAHPAHAAAPRADQSLKA